MPAAINFPSIKPSGRSYEAGSYPERKFEALNGAVTVMRYGNRRVNSKLSLTFSALTGDQVALILQNYEQVMQGWNYVSLTTANGLAGSSNSLNVYLGESTSGLRWRYAKAPAVTAIGPDRHDVSCEFTGYLDAP